MTYQDYLLTDEWKDIRKRAIERAGHRCQLCNNGEDILSVHHRCYNDSIQEIDIMDLVVLCRACHAVFHRSKKLKKVSAPIDVDKWVGLK